MFASMKNRGTVIAKGLKIVGRVTAEGLVEVNGQIDGEIHCTSLIISPHAGPTSQGRSPPIVSLLMAMLRGQFKVGKSF